MLRLAQLGRDVDTSKIISHTLSDGPSGMLHAKIVNEAYVLLPDDGNYKDIKTLWQNIFYAPAGDALTTETGIIDDAELLIDDKNEEPDQNQEEKPVEDNLPEPNNNLTIISNYENEGATIEIRNGTWTTGYAGKEKKKLEERGFEVIGAVNADNHDYAKTVIYSLSNDSFPETATELFKIYDVRPTDGSVLINSSADFVIILGTN
jgi:hypothetical protein